MNSKPDAELLSDLDSTVAWAKSQGGDTSRLGIIGFCRGGRTVWEYAADSPTLKAAVAFCGPPVDPPNPLWPKSPTQLAPEMKAPVKAALAHGFHAYYRASYRKEAADDAWARMQAWFKKYGVLS